MRIIRAKFLDKCMELMLKTPRNRGAYFDYSLGPLFSQIHRIFAVVDQKPMKIRSKRWGPPLSFHFHNIIKTEQRPSKKGGAPICWAVTAELQLRVHWAGPHVGRLHVGLRPTGGAPTCRLAFIGRVSLQLEGPTRRAALPGGALQMGWPIYRAPIPAAN